jgi:DNA mismatch repair protein MutL
LSQFQTASADLAQAMKWMNRQKFNYQPQPKYQEQFNLHRNALSKNHNKSAIDVQQIY